MLAARVEPKNAPQKSKKTDNFKPLVLGQFQTGADSWINYMLKDRQKSEFDGFVDCIIIESLHNPIADA